MPSRRSNDDWVAVVSLLHHLASSQQRTLLRDRREKVDAPKGPKASFLPPLPAAVLCRRLLRLPRQIGRERNVEQDEEGEEGGEDGAHP